MLHLLTSEDAEKQDWRIIEVLDEIKIGCNDEIKQRLCDVAPKAVTTIC